MTEGQWVACNDPGPMLVELLREKASGRKLRLFSTACCRRVWQFLSDERSRKAIEVAERYVDNRASRTDLSVAHEDAQQAFVSSLGSARHIGNAAQAAAFTCGEDFLAIPALVRRAMYWSVTLDPQSQAEEHAMLARIGFSLKHLVPTPARSKVASDEWYVQIGLLRDIFGNPFHSSAVDPFWVTSTVTMLAQAIYEGAAFHYLPILADALEETRCMNAEILSHCRGPGPHVRGCWVIDALLGKG